jgi:MoxR-like ATPase
VGYPDADREMAIIRARRPQAAETLAGEVVQFVQELRQRDLFKAPGVAETLDWISALHELDCVSLDPEVINDTLGVLLKYQDDIVKLEGSEAKRILDRIKSEIRTQAPARTA